jgi:hypothetical protein
MNNQDYTNTFTVDQAPQDVFKAICNPRGWWSEEIQGDTDRLGAVFFYSYQDVHRGTFKVTEFKPGERIAWHVLQNYLSFVEDTTEWTGTDIVFDLSRDGGKTKVRFTHVGLNPGEQCYDACHEGWGFYVGTSLRELITKGRGQPNRQDRLSENNPVKK